MSWPGSDEPIRADNVCSLGRSARVEVALEMTRLTLRKQTQRQDAAMHLRRFGALLDYVVGKRQHLRRNFDPEGLRGVEVEDQLKSGGLHDRQIGWLLTL
jgi:hypothetical protein